VTVAAPVVDTAAPDHRAAMGLAATEYQQFIALLHDLGTDDWSKPTDCPLWDVQATVAHSLGHMEANASLRELVHQMRTATKRSKAESTLMIDELTALQVEERAAMSPQDLVTRIEAVVPEALAGRRRTPGILRRLMKVEAPPPFVSITLGFLIDTIFTRDLWMHRVDICRATGEDMVLSAEHDGRLVAAIVGEWADRHGQPDELSLDGPAGGTFRHGLGGESIRLDAVEFCRVLSGRDAANARGLLTSEVLF
jgi:uncharacterized protein (TIGR03083 family)